MDNSVQPFCWVEKTCRRAKSTKLLVLQCLATVQQAFQMPWDKHNSFKMIRGASIRSLTSIIYIYNIYGYMYIRHKCIHTHTKLYTYIYMIICSIFYKMQRDPYFNRLWSCFLLGQRSASPMFFGCPVFLYEVVEVIVRPGPHCQVGRRQYQRRNPRVCALQNGTTSYETIKQHGKNFKIRHYKTMSAMSQQKVNVFLF